MNERQAKKAFKKKYGCSPKKAAHIIAGAVMNWADFVEEFNKNLGRFIATTNKEDEDASSYKHG